MPPTYADMYGNAAGQRGSGRGSPGNDPMLGPNFRYMGPPIGWGNEFGKGGWWGPDGPKPGRLKVEGPTKFDGRNFEQWKEKKPGFPVLRSMR